ncbi:hypothetical protein [Paenibacillus terrigena]|nr:hypothetical protein [Paenibacillus terrigena]
MRQIHRVRLIWFINISHHSMGITSIVSCVWLSVQFEMNGKPQIPSVQA